MRSRISPEVATPTQTMCRLERTERKRHGSAWFTRIEPDGPGHCLRDIAPTRRSLIEIAAVIAVGTFPFSNRQSRFSPAGLRAVTGRLTLPRARHRATMHTERVMR